VEAALLAFVEERHPFGDHDDVSVAPDEALAQQAGEMEWAAQASASPGGRGEPKQVGHRPGAHQGGPVAAHEGIVGGVTRGIGHRL